MSSDVKKAIEKLKKESGTPRGRVVLYFDKPLLKEFQTLCKKEGTSASKVLEEVMREYVTSAKKSAK